MPSERRQQAPMQEKIESDGREVFPLPDPRPGQGENSMGQLFSEVTRPDGEQEHQENKISDYFIILDKINLVLNNRPSRLNQTQTTEAITESLRIGWRRFILAVPTTPNLEPSLTLAQQAMEEVVEKTSGLDDKRPFDEAKRQHEILLSLTKESNEDNKPLNLEDTYLSSFLTILNSLNSVIERQEGRAKVELSQEEEIELQQALNQLFISGHHVIGDKIYNILEAIAERFEQYIDLKLRLLLGDNYQTSPLEATLRTLLKLKDQYEESRLDQRKKQIQEEFNLTSRLREQEAGRRRKR